MKQDLPDLSKFLLCAAYLASYIPPSQDLRIFSKGADKRKRRTKVTKKGAQKRQVGFNLFHFIFVLDTTYSRFSSCDKE